ncbi:MAG: MiaB/RimO family radical SAM methylthiotransferase [Alphaproteobacteria bacterium]|nr:MiaB/RimO family radical SAM methylthiotransferase [Alphaproteobacteria bacterium]
MQEKENIKFISLGCRLNTLEAEKIKAMLESAGMQHAVIINTCSVTGAAEKQSRQAIRRAARENPDASIFITGCAATRDSDEISKIAGTAKVITNEDKFNLSAYGIDEDKIGNQKSEIINFTSLSKGFVQIQSGCDNSCAFCIVSKLRGKNVSFAYEQILNDAHALTDNGYNEIVLTGVNISGFRRMSNEQSAISNDLVWLCKKLLNDLPGLKRLRLSSLDPGVDLSGIVELIKSESRILPHLHLSMQSGSNTILRAMARRHSADQVRKYCTGGITFSWDLICGFPGETDEPFMETVDLVKELRPVRIHAFPFSVRPGTRAADMPNQVSKDVARRRVKIINELARENMRIFMESQIGNTVSVLMEKNNIGRDEHDIPVHVVAAEKSIIDVKLIGINDDLEFIGQIG